MWERILDRAKSRVDAAEVYGVTSEDMSVSFEAGTLKKHRTLTGSWVLGSGSLRMEG